MEYNINQRGGMVGKGSAAVGKVIVSGLLGLCVSRCAAATVLAIGSLAGPFARFSQGSAGFDGLETVSGPDVSGVPAGWLPGR